MKDIAFHHLTPIEVQQTLIQALVHEIRIRLVYGDTLTGKSYLTSKEVEGLVLYHPWDDHKEKSRLIIQRRPGTHGAPILDQLIVRIVRTDGLVLYQHPTYQPFTSWHEARIFWDGWKNRIKFSGGETLSKPFKTRQSAQRWLNKMIKWEM